MKMVQVLRAKGHSSLTRDEELLRSRLEILAKQLQERTFKAKMDEMDAQMKLLKNSQQWRESAVNSSSGSGTSSSSSKPSFQVLDQQAVQNVDKTLMEIQKGFDKVTKVLKQDFEAVDLMDRGYKQKPGEVSFRSSFNGATVGNNSSIR